MKNNDNCLVLFLEPSFKILNSVCIRRFDVYVIQWEKTDINFADFLNKCLNHTTFKENAEKFM